jgi:hypothetical protein
MLTRIAQKQHVHHVLLQRSFTRSEAAPSLACPGVTLLVVFYALELSCGMIFETWLGPLRVAKFRSACHGSEAGT